MCLHYHVTLHFADTLNPLQRIESILVHLVKKILYWPLLTGIVLSHLMVFIDWLSLNKRIAKGVCCGFTEPVTLEIRRLVDSDLGAWTLDRGIAPRLGAWAISTMGESGLLLLSMTSVLITSVIAAHFCRRYGRPWWGLWAAAIFPMFPYVAAMARRWDAYTLQMPFILLGLWILIESKRFSKIIPSVLFGFCCFILGVLSSRETDNLLALLSMGSVAFSVLTMGVISGRDDTGRTIGRIRISLTACAVFSFTLIGTVQWMTVSSPEGWDYYRTESNVPLTVSSFLSYGSYLMDRGLGPWFSTAFLISVCSAIVLPKRRWALFLAWALPLIALSFMPKKKHYYIAVVWPVLPVFCALALSKLPKLIGIPAALWPLVMGCFAYLGMSLPMSFGDTFPAKRQWVRGDPRQFGHFQTSDDNLSLGPQSDPWAHDFIDKVVPRVPLKCPFDIGYQGTRDIGELQVRLALLRPCASLRRLETRANAKQYWIESTKIPTKNPNLSLLMSHVDQTDKAIYVFSSK